MAPIVALLRTPHGPFFTDRAHTLGHADLLGGRRLLAFLSFRRRSLVLLMPGGLDVRLDGGQGQQGGFDAGGQGEDVVGVEIAIAEHLAQQTRLLLRRHLRWALQILVALQGVYLRPHGLAVQAADTLPDLGGLAPAPLPNRRASVPE